MAKTSDVSEKIIQALADYLKRDAASIQTTHHLRDDLGLDSMAVIEMLYRIEEVFNLQIPDQDLVGLTTVGQVIAYVQGRVASPKAPAKVAEKAPAKAAAKKPAAKGSTKSKKA